MGDIARCSEGSAKCLHNEDLLYRLFGVNAELLIDHAWGWEPAEIADCKAYAPKSRSLSHGQVLSRPYTAAEGRTVAMEMADQLSMELVKKGFFTDHTVLDVGYDVESLNDRRFAALYTGEVESDRYGRRVPKGVHGSCSLEELTSSSVRIIEAVGGIYDRIVDRRLLVRRMNIAVCRLVTAGEKEETAGYEQLDLFGLLDSGSAAAAERLRQEKERRIQEALLAIRERYGKNSVIRGLNMRQGATAIERNRQVGGHKA